MRLSVNHIQKLVEDYAKTKGGKAATKKQYGIDYNPKKDPVKQGKIYAQKMKEILYKYIQSIENERGKPSLSSVQLDDIVIGAPKPDQKGNYTITLSLRNVDRKSLWEKGHPDGTYDIVGLFYHGYSYSEDKRVYGEWRGSRIGSRVSRSANPFIQEAVDEFNKEMGKEAEATLVGEYAKE